jgi:hypothetical protein
MRRTIDPFISGDTFRLRCKHIIDEHNQTLDIATIQENDTIFVKTDYIQGFYQVSSHIKVPFKLITHNSDYPTTMLSEDNIIDLTSRCKWFAQNNTSKYITSIPIGLQNNQWVHSLYVYKNLCRYPFQVKDLFRKPRNNLLYLGMNTDTNPYRKNIVEYIEKQLNIKNIRLDWEDYIKMLKESVFCICPEGNGIDTHRVWECLYSGCIPIVKQGTTPDLLEELPVLFVKEWTDINIDFLVEEYNKIKKGVYNFDKLFINYWNNIIFN